MIKQQAFLLIDDLKALDRFTVNWAKRNLPWRNVLWPSPLRAQESATEQLDSHLKELGYVLK